VTKLIALLALIVIAIGCTFGNYWYTFGLWPKSWTAFVLFGLAQMIITAAITAVSKDR
jgi:hypothetical protein